MITEDFSNSISIGAAAPAFQLLDTHGETCTLETFADHDWLVLQFTCNHCPYALGSDDRLRAVVSSLAGENIALVGICSNDAERYPQDSYERMQERAPTLPYRYLHDPTQETAQAYCAQVTPEFFIFARSASSWQLAWHGTIDDSPREAAEATTAYLLPALESLVQGKTLARQTTPVQGCSIKWV